MSRQGRRNWIVAVDLVACPLIAARRCADPAANGRRRRPRRQRAEGAIGSHRKHEQQEHPHEHAPRVPDAPGIPRMYSTYQRAYRVSDGCEATHMIRSSSLIPASALMVKAQPITAFPLPMALPFAAPMRLNAFSRTRGPYAHMIHLPMRCPSADTHAGIDCCRRCCLGPRSHLRTTTLAQRPRFPPLAAPSFRGGEGAWGSGSFGRVPDEPRIPGLPRGAHAQFVGCAPPILGVRWASATPSYSISPSSRAFATASAVEVASSLPRAFFNCSPIVAALTPRSCAIWA